MLEGGRSTLLFGVKKDIDPSGLSLSDDMFAVKPIDYKGFSRHPKAFHPDTHPLCDPPLDDLIKSHECTAEDKQNVRGINMVGVHLRCFWVYQLQEKP